MRPLRLELEGFTVYKKPQTIDFEKLSFFVIQGKTGAGKTSIVDAITYALYGKVPRYGDAKATKHVISKGSSSMRVALDFSVREKKYRIERFYSPRLKEDQARAYEDGRRLNLSKPQIERWVKEITGLDYRTFTRVILLPQGEFDRFLKPKQPKERREILINLLDLEIFERMRQIASETYREKEGELRTLKEELERLKDVSEEKLLELERRERETEEKVKEINREVSSIEEEIRILEGLEKVEREIEEVRREKEAVLREVLKKKEEIKQAEARAKEVEKKAERIPELKKSLEAVLKDFERVEGAIRELEEIRRKEERLKHIEEALSARKKDLKDREERIERGKELIKKVQEELERIDFDEERFAEVLRDLERKRNLGIKVRRLETLRQEIQKIGTRLEDMNRKAEDLEEMISLKEKELKKKVIHLYAHRIREVLEEGDECPVCGGTFGRDRLPSLDTDVSGLEGEVERLKEEKSKLERESAQLEGRLKGLREEERRLLTEIRPFEELLERDVEGEFMTLKEKKDKKAELEKRMEAYRKRYEELISEKEIILKEVERLGAEKETLRREVEERKRKLENILSGDDPQRKRKELAERKREIEETIENMEREKEMLRTRLEELKRSLASLEAKRDSLEKRLSKGEEERKELLSRLAKVRGRPTAEDLKILREKLSSLKSELSKAFEDLGEIRKLKEQTREALSRRREVEEKVSRTEREVRVYKVLAEDLRSDRLQNFVASLMLLRVVERASHYLLNFTGTYELTADDKGNLLVVDRVQGVERDVSSLSGGETFLASLSLALGVSDILSSQANLESLFIDEGFGSLDEETRERVSEILEVVRININRMVGIISHIPDLAERFHQRIVVKKHGDYSTVEVIC